MQRELSLGGHTERHEKGTPIAMDTLPDPLAATGPFPSLAELTTPWGDWNTVSLYLDRCQVDTPTSVVEAVWSRVLQLRPTVGKVVDFGAGDARFAEGRDFREYVGYEIDHNRFDQASLPERAHVLARCAFTDDIRDADVCIGNPPYVRNQDLPTGWRTLAADILLRRTGVHVSGLANAWQYFFLLALASLNPDGLCALIVPYEWVSRPSVKPLRDYIRRHRWNVSVYRLADTTFNHVLTTSSITIIDKARRNGQWCFFQDNGADCFHRLASPTTSDLGVIPYLARRERQPGTPWAQRGLSPGSQKALTLTEGERVRNDLSAGVDVVPCITSLRRLPADSNELDTQTFNTVFRDQGAKCWLVRTDRVPSPKLRLYLDAVPPDLYETSTCRQRDIWWNFSMPRIPDALFAQSFKGTFPKCVRNTVRARAVGGVCGLFDIPHHLLDIVLSGFNGMDLRDRVVAHSNGFRKIEIGQINTLLRLEFDPSHGC